MSTFNKAIKLLQLGILQDAGVAVTPEQLGLKLSKGTTATTGANPFASYLQGINGGLGSTSTANGLNNPLSMPVAPKPPDDPTDVKAQNLYQQQLATYNAKLMQVFLMRLTQQQQAQLTANRQASNAKSSSPGTTFDNPSTLGVGGIF
jgi:hypothetical protein